MRPWWLIEPMYTGKVELIPHWWKGNFDVVCCRKKRSFSGWVGSPKNGGFWDGKQTIGCGCVKAKCLLHSPQPRLKGSAIRLGAPPQILRASFLAFSYYRTDRNGPLRASREDTTMIKKELYEELIIHVDKTEMARLLNIDEDFVVQQIEEDGEAIRLIFGRKTKLSEKNPHRDERKSFL
jgi:hypothetical protein